MMSNLKVERGRQGSARDTGAPSAENWRKTQNRVNLSLGVYSGWMIRTGDQ